MGMPIHPLSPGNTAFAHCGGELAYQLGKEEGYELVKAADENGTSPGKDVLKTLLKLTRPVWYSLMNW